MLREEHWVHILEIQAWSKNKQDIQDLNFILRLKDMQTTGNKLESDVNELCKIRHPLPPLRPRRSTTMGYSTLGWSAG